MNIGKAINDIYYFSSKQEGRACEPVGFITKFILDYNENVLPSVLKLLPEDFSLYFMENNFCCGFTVNKVSLDPINETVTLTLSRNVSIGLPREEKIRIEFLDVHPMFIFHDDEDYPIPLKGAIIFGFIIMFSSKNNRVKPSCKRPLRCNILLNNRLSIDLVFSSVRFTQTNP